MNDAQRRIVLIAVFVCSCGNLRGAFGRSGDVPQVSPPEPVQLRHSEQQIAQEGTERSQTGTEKAKGGEVGEPNGMTFADLQQIALENNPTIAQASRRVAALGGKYVQVGLKPNPVTGYQGEEMGDEGSAGQQGVFFGQRFITGGKLKLNRAVVTHEIERSRQALEIQRQRVLNDVRVRAYEVVIAQRTIDLNEQLVEISNSAANVAKELAKAKEVGQVDVLRARVEANTARLQLNNARNQYTAFWRKLVLVLGVPDMEPTALADELQAETPTFTWEESTERLLSQSAELTRAWADVERARWALARAEAGRFPDVDVKASVRHNNASDYTTASIAVGIPLMIFNRNQGNIHRTHAELAAARREVRRVELDLQDRLATIFRSYTNARQQTEQYKSEILPDAESSLKLVQAGYQQGEFGYLELLTAQRTYTQVSLAYLQAIRELRVSAVQVEGLLVTGGLQAAEQ